MGPVTHLRNVLATLAALLFMLPTASAHLGGDPGSGGEWVPPPASKDVQVPRGEVPCPGVDAAWRENQTVEGVEIRSSMQCAPDNPEVVAAFVKGTNNMPAELLDRVGLHEDAVVKGEDKDGDGDPDVINITLEVSELNGWHLADEEFLAAEGFKIAPGIQPGFWVFSPKTTGMETGPAHALMRMPSPPIRVEVGDEVRITLENTHYFPHTIHLHGVDHPFLDATGEGNDGVPHVSENPVKPGMKRTYEFTARQPGSMFYHCHVQPQTHVLMGLNGLIIVEEDRPDNWIQTLNVGAGEVRHPAKATLETYDREYDLHYQDFDKELGQIVQSSNDPRVIAEAMNREYKSSDRDPEYFLLNGRSFPYTMRESVVAVAPNETIKLRVLNGGTEVLSLHTHGHKPTAEAFDGVPAPDGGQVARDVHTLTAAQRTDLRLNTTDDGLHSYGPGVWLMHDHREQAVTTDNIGPGGDISAIAYEGFWNETTRLPETFGHDLHLFFTEEYYRGEIPVWTLLGEDDILGEVDDDATAQGADGGTSPSLTGAVDIVILVAAAAVLGVRRVRRGGDDA